MGTTVGLDGEIVTYMEVKRAGEVRYFKVCNPVECSVEQDGTQITRHVSDIKTGEPISVMEELTPEEYQEATG